MSEIEQLRNDFLLLKNEFETYKKSGFWQRRDVLKTGGIGLLALLGVDSAKADTVITDSGIDIGGLSVQLANHDHNGGDGAQINHTTLSNIGTNTHAQVDTHLAASAPHSGHETPAGAQTKVDTHAAVAAPHSGHNISATQNYTGNSGVNRAIAHGLGRTPKVILLYTTGATAGNMYIIIGGYGSISSNMTTNPLAVTAPDSTNFYVGHATNYGYSANLNGEVYRWVVIA